MLRHITLGLVSAIAVIVLVIVLFIGYSVAGPFFSEMGGETHESIGGVSGDSAINFSGGLAFVGLSMLSIPTFLGLVYLYSGGSTGRRRPPRRRRP